MEQDSKTTNSGNIVDNHRNPDGTFKEGHPKLGGKQIGTRDFATDFDEVVEEIAEENGITKSQARKHLLKVAYKQSKDGNYSFYKDIHDRIYGQAKQVIDQNITLPTPLLNALPNLNRNQEDKPTE